MTPRGPRKLPAAWPARGPQGSQDLSPARLPGPRIHRTGLPYRALPPDAHEHLPMFDVSNLPFMGLPSDTT